MVKDFKYIIRRILIGVGIALVLGYIGTLTGFIVPLDVYAKDYEPHFNIGVDNGTDKPVLKNGVNSNAFISNFDNQPNMQFGYGQVNVSINDLDSNNGVNVPYWDNFDTLKNDLTDRFSFPNYSGYNSYVYYYNFKPNGNIYLDYDNHYTFILQIKREDNTNFDVGFPNVILDSFNISIGNNNDLIDVKDYVSNLSIKYYKFQEKVDVPSDYHFIMVEFDITSDDFPSYNGMIYLQNIQLSSDIFYNNSSVKLPLSYFLESHRVGNNDNAYFDVDFYFLENCHVFPSGSYCDINGCKTGMGYSGSWDFVTSEDIAIENSIGYCPDEFTLESLICNVKRVFDIIFRFFVRIGNFINEFMNDVFYNYIEPQFGVDTGMTPVSDLLTMPVTLINAFIDGVDGQCTPYVFGTLYDYQLHLPCINIKDIVGVSLYTIIDGLCSIFMLFNIGSLIVTFFDRSTSLDDMFGLLYHVRDYNRQLADDEANGVVR